MKTLAAILTLALAGAQDDDARKKFEELKKDILKKEAEGGWKKIAWEKDLAEARKKAAEGGKPLVVVLVVGHLAQKNAAEC